MGLIYKLIVGDFWYVGKTINKFKIRYNHHKRDCFNKKGDGYNTLKYVIFRKMGVSLKNWNEMVKFKIVYECNDNLLYSYENLSINLDDPWCLNMIGCKIDKIIEVEVVRWGTTTKKMKKEQRHKYYLDNIEKLKIIREENKDKIKLYDKKHYEDNKEMRKEQMKKHYENNKNYECKCCNSNMMTKGDYNKHIKTKKHIRKVNNQDGTN
tara:strand:- start:283 stop:909 length:627 start_codon:yes stop_codon:yes gene_type:complete